MKHIGSAALQKVPVLKRLPEKYGKGCNHGFYCGEACVGLNATGLVPPVDKLDALDRACKEHDECLKKNTASANTMSCGCGPMNGGNCGCDEDLRGKANRCVWR